MKTLFSLLRLLTIIRILLRHGLDELLWIIPWLRPLRYLSRLLPRSRRHRGGQGKRLRLALEDLGPVFIKFGQALSTRRDLLTPELADEFRYLQDQVPPFPGETARQIIEASCGQSISDLFREFETQPMASASVAQVHAARLHDGTAVVVKVLRPNIDKTIRQDIRLMYIIAGLLQRYWKEGKRLRPVDIVYEYEKNILDELDMQREAANASQLRRNFEGSDDLYIPEVYWDYSTDHVMVMERIYGIPIGDIEALKKQHINFQRLAERGVEIFFTQVFKHNFFHADMHPGNIFVEPHKPDDPRYLAVDFGIIGTLSADDQRYLAENFHAFFNRDYRRVAELHVESGWVPAHTRIEEFESAIRAVCEPIFERPISEISFGHLLLRLFQTARRFEMEVQPQLVLLQKTLLNIEGLGRQLYPELNLWVTAKPFIERWIDEQVGFRALLRGAQYNIPKLLENLPYMPNLVFDILKQTQQNRLKLQWESQQLSQLQKTTAQQYYRIRLILTGGIMVIAASLNIGQSLNFLLNPLIWNGLFMSIGGLLLLVGLIK